MRIDLATMARSGVIALGMLGLFTLPSVAGPAAMVGSADVSARSALTPLLVQSTEPDTRSDNNRRWNGRWDNDNWRRRNFRRHWNNRNDWRPRRSFRHGPSIYFGLGLVPSYRYVEPRRYIQPRRVYRSSGLSQAHVNWCYNRYQSYRAWDNTFQPYHGPRQQCWSPYS